jgi:dTDP-4-amino-4,6-dideoxygalactose transaminase
MIPFNKPYIIGKEIENITQAVEQYKQISGDGKFSHLCQEWLAVHLNSSKALLTHSCTAALEMAAILADIQPGDEIIMPSFTFVSTANAFVLRGGVPVFVDIREDTLNIDENQIEAAITERTKVIVPVHYAGNPCEMDVIMKIADKYNLFVIEDAAQALLSKYNDKCLGTIGHMGCLSFHETKNIISGEGGALLINDERFIERAEIIWEKGTNRKKFGMGEVDKYSWVDIGSSFLPSEIIAAFLYAQFEQANEIISKRQQIMNMYFEGLKPLADRKLIRLPIIDNNHTANGHIFYIIVNSSEERNELLTYLNKNGINAVFHYVPLHSSPAGMRFCKVKGSLVNTDSISNRIIRLPLFFEMTAEQINIVVQSIFAFYGKQ